MLDEEIQKINSIKSNKAKEQAYRKIMKTEKTNTAFLYSFAKFLLSLNRKKDNKEVRFLLNEIIHHSNDKKLVENAKIKKACFLQSIAEYTYAENLFREVLKNDPNNYKCIVLYAQLKYKVCEVETAKKLLKYCLDNDKTKTRTIAYHNLIELYIAEQDYDNALEIVNVFLQDPNTKKYNNFINFSLARIYRGKKNYDQACFYINQITGLNYKLGNLALEKVCLYTELNDTEKLNKAYQDLKYYASIEEKIEIQSSLMLIEEKNGNDEGRLEHKNKMLSLKNIYKRQNNDHFKW